MEEAPRSAKQIAEDIFGRLPSRANQLNLKAMSHILEDQESTGMAMTDFSNTVTDSDDNVFFACEFNKEADGQYRNPYTGLIEGTDQISTKFSNEDEQNIEKYVKNSQ